jgi:hypothetical protein
MAIAMGMATGFWWWEQSASALGTDPTGDAYFNATMVALGAMFIPAAFVGGDILLDARSAAVVGRRWGMLGTVGLFTICLALALVGIYRIDEGPQASTIHNIAGFSVPLIVMAMMSSIRWNARALPPRFERTTYLWLAGIVAMFVVAVLALMSYALMEMVAFVICWWWLYGLLRALDDRLGGSVGLRHGDDPRGPPLHVKAASVATGPLGLAILMAAVGTIGLGSVIAQAEGDIWTALTVSQLSADAGAGPWFRATMLACGAIAIALAIRMSALLTILVGGGRMSALGGLFRVAFFAIGLRLPRRRAVSLGVAPLIVWRTARPYAIDRGPHPHALPFAIGLGDRFERLSLAAIAVVLLLYVAAIGGWIAYAPMELAGFGIGGAWLVAFVARLEAIARAPGRPRG